MKREINQISGQGLDLIPFAVETSRLSENYINFTNFT
jgi:hypothetical protein